MVLGATTGLPVGMAATGVPQAAAPTDANPLEGYQQICRMEALRQGAPEAIAQGSCRCLQERLDAMEQPPHAPGDLKAFTEENRLPCVFEAILQL